MKRVWGHVLTGLSVIAAGGVVGPACTHDDSSFFIQNVLAQQLVTPGQQCSYTADPTQPQVSSGVLDVDFRQQYDAMFLVGNQLVPQANAAQGRTETAAINIQGAIVRITDSSGNQLTTFTRLTGGTVYPSSGSTPGFLPISVTILDQGTVSSQTGSIGGGTVRLITYTKFFGKTLGGQSIESNEFTFAIDVCQGCLIRFSAADINPCFTAPNCLGNSASGVGTAQTPVPCIPGQDLGVDCSQCAGTVAACNPPATPTCADAGTGGG
jgi:hypothetical protein